MLKNRVHSAAAWAAHMRNGRYESAWRISDAVLRRGSRPDLPRHFQTLWRGQPIAGARVLIRCYRGLGDTIQFIRYVPMIKAVAREVTVCAQAELIPLLKTMKEIDRLIELDSPEEEPLTDQVETEITELPYIFRTTTRTIPDRVPYFQVPPAPLPEPKGLAIGTVWAAGDWDKARSVPVRDLAPLKGAHGITWYSFQRGAAAKDARRIGAIPLTWDNIVQEAGLMRSLDLLISVDTMPAHLAGALGVPVWLMLHAKPDWRWMLGRDDSPWYPTMRLFRQETTGDWRSVIQRIAAEL